MSSKNNSEDVKSTEEKIGFFNNTEKKNEEPKGNKGGKLDISYQPDIPPAKPFDPALPTRAALVNSDKRGSIRMPLETKHEFDALLEVSEYQYAYELLGEMHNLYMQKLSPEQLRLFNASLENIKRKAALKEAKKKK